jgi:hypothetical protein
MSLAYTDIVGTDILCGIAYWAFLAQQLDLLLSLFERKSLKLLEPADQELKPWS